MPSTRSSSARRAPAAAAAAAAAAGSAIPAPLSSSSTSGTHHNDDPDNSRGSGLRKRPTTTAGAGAADLRTTTGSKAAGSTSLDGHSEQDLDANQSPQLDVNSDDKHKDIAMSFTQRNRWIVFAVASGACAAFNGVFAKLTTNDLTTTIANAISDVFHLSDGKGFVELVVRVIFFSLNLVFNGVMWTLFTQALAKGNSTTQVSIMNTSTNFMITAILGFVIFSEALPPLWWLGAAMLVAGNVIIGRKDGQDEDEAQSIDPLDGEYRDDEDGDTTAGSGGLLVDGDLESGSSSSPRQRDEDEDVPLIGEL